MRQKGDEIVTSREGITSHWKLALRRQCEKKNKYNKGE